MESVIAPAFVSPTFVLRYRCAYGNEASLHVPKALIVPVWNGYTFGGGLWHRNALEIVKIGKAGVSVSCSAEADLGPLARIGLLFAGYPHGHLNGFSTLKAAGWQMRARRP